jgi:hypothetical protein
MRSYELLPQSKHWDISSMDREDRDTLNGIFISQNDHEREAFLKYLDQKYGKKVENKGASDVYYTR